MRLNDIRRLTPALWAPDAIAATNIAWYRAGYLVTLADGKVSAWGDLTGNGHTLTQVDPAHQFTPIASDSQFGGQPSMNALGATTSYKAMQTSAFAAVVQPLTYYAVVGIPAVTGQTNGILDASSASRVFLYHSNTYANLYAGTGVASPANTVAIGAQCWCATLGSTDRVYVNNFTTAVASGNAGNDSMSQITVGSAANDLTSAPMNGYIAEILIRSGEDDLATRLAVRAYMLARYKI